MALDLKDRETALSRVPHDVQGLIEKLTKRVNEEQDTIAKIKSQFDSKVDKSVFF
jgi:hypothetical protein